MRRRFRALWSLRGVLMAMAVLAPAVAADPHCVLINPSFELSGSDGREFAEWEHLGDVDPTAGIHGQRAAAVRGPNFGAWGVSAIRQALPTTPGERWRVRVLAGHASTDPVLGQTRGIVNVEWRDAADALISYETRNVVVAGDPADVFEQVDFTTAPAPAAAVSTRILLGIIQGPDLASGTVVYDAIRFEPADESADDMFQLDSSIGGRTVEFSGRTWWVKGPGVFGPGPNSFDDSESAVWVDGDGLHLTIRDDSGWSSSEVILDPMLGYGDYRFTVEGRPDLWADNVVLGLFLWETRACYELDELWWNPHNEFDIELSRWGIPGNDVAQFAAQPSDYAGNRERFAFTTTPDQTTTTFAFRWLADRIECRAWRGGLADEHTGEVITTWTYTGPHIPRPERPHVRLNFWQVWGDPPADGHDHEALVAAFGFAPACPADANNDGIINLDDIDAFVLSFVGASADGDVNGDGAINIDDIDVFVTSFISACG